MISVGSRLTLAALALAACLGASFVVAPAVAQVPISTSAVSPVPNPVGEAGSATPAPPTLPGSTVVDVGREAGSTKSTPAFRLLPQFVPGSEDWSRPYADVLDGYYNQWLAFKKGISDQYNLDLAIDYSFYPQWGTKGQPVYLNVYYPSATWRAFTDTPIGSGKIDVVSSHQAYFSTQNTSTQATRLGLITFANDWTKDNFAWSTVAYTHTLPGSLNWLSFTFGQYNLFSFDPNEYAANAQTGFISYSFAQDATQTFPNAGLGGYGRIKTPDGQFSLAGGVQGATDLNGGRLTTQGFDKGKLVNWGNAQWTPKFPVLGDGIYSLLVYDQPFVPFVSGHSVGTSFSASQDITEKYGVFLRLNSATGADIPIRRSYAWGGVWNNPIGRNGNDQLGLAAGWNKTNHDLTGYAGTRDGEWVSEIYYKATIFKGMHVTPDIQVFWNPALAPKASAEAVFTLRTTVSF
jgi:Carbohydrate-selective porin, OprB family